MTAAIALYRETRRLWRLGRLVLHIIVGAVIAHAVFHMLTLAVADRDRRRERALVRWWNRSVLRILNVRLHLEGQIPAGAVLFAANHVSWLDIPCLRAVVDGVFVAKDEVRRWPVIGRLSERAGTIFLKRGVHSTSNEAAEHMTWSLARHQPVILFPEGTTSDGRSVRYFYGRLYQAAVRTQGMVQAVAIAYPYADDLNDDTSIAEDKVKQAVRTHPCVPFLDNDGLVPHLWRLLKEDGIDARLIFCTPQSATGGERSALAARSRAQILETLGLMPGRARTGH